MELNHLAETARSPQELVLVVDDDHAIVEGVADLLRYAGYHVLTAPDGVAALELVNSGCPDLIISDIMMPNMDGYRFCEAVRSNSSWASTPFIFLTARGQANEVRSGTRLGADAYIVKPFEPEDLLLAVESRLKRTREIQSVTQAEVNAMKQHLITIFSHELRTPLTYIYGYVNLLEEEHPKMDIDSIDQMLGGIRQGAERLKRLVDDLMFMVRIDSGVTSLDYLQNVATSNIIPGLRDAIERQAVFAASRAIQLNVDLPDRLEMQCVAWYVADAFERVLNNAIKFSKHGGGDVTIQVFQSGRQAVICVCDHGIGIALARQKHIFEPFRQLDRDTMEQQGTGLGLTIARSLVELHGGVIEVQSEPGAGSTFTMRLPITEANVALSPDTPSAAMGRM